MSLWKIYTETKTPWELISLRTGHQQAFLDLVEEPHTSQQGRKEVSLSLFQGLTVSDKDRLHNSSSTFFLHFTGSS
jgi:hypothetical protein